jgi:hypothetical protein
MKVLLIVPPYINNDYYMPSLGIYILARQLINMNIEVMIIDYSFELKTGNLDCSDDIYFKCANDIVSKASDVICFSCNCMTILPAIQISKIIKSFCDTIIVIGGPIATTSKELIIKYDSIDYVTFGEGEYNFPKLISFLKNKEPLHSINVCYKQPNGVIETLYSNMRTDFNNYDIIPAYELMPNKEEIKKINNGKIFIPCEAGRGCSFNCAFCCSSKIWNNRVDFFNREIILKQLDKIKELYSEATIYFTCDNLIFNKSLLSFLCDALQNRRLKWQCRGRLDIDIDYKKLYESGCEMIMIGVESAQSETWEKTHKGKFPENIEEKLSNIAKLGIGITATFIIGFPFEDKTDMNNTLKQALRIANLPNSDVTIHALTPLPETEIYSSHKKIYFNGGTDLVRGLEFTGELSLCDVLTIKNDPETFVAFYSFENDLYNNRNINFISETFTLLCKTPKFTDYLLNFINYPIEKIFDIAEKISRDKTNYEIIIKTLIIEYSLISKKEKIFLLELFETEVTLQQIKPSNNKLINTLPNYSILLKNSNYIVCCCSKSVIEFINNKTIPDFTKKIDNNKTYLIVLNKSNRKYGILRIDSSLENIAYIIQIIGY